MHNETVPVNNPNLRPPLARQLFDSRFWSIAHQYVGVQVLGAELGRLAHLQDVPFDLERRLSDYAASSDARTRRHFKDIPPYLRDLLIRVSRDYVPSPTNYINLTRRLLQDGTHNICFVTLNYDTLLETALRLYDQNLAINELADYVADDRQAWVVKIHGSTNWAIEIPQTSANDGRQNPNLILELWDPSKHDPDSTIMNQAQDDSRDWRNHQTGACLYPRLTAPLREKSFVCPTQHTTRLVDFLQQCHKFLIIGSSGLDDDLLDFMRARMNGQDFVVQYVNYDLETTLAVRERFEEHIPVFRGGSPRSIQPKLAHKGFTTYLDTGDLEEFLAAD